MNPPKVIIENEVYQKIMHWVKSSDYEVSGLGMLRVEENGVLRVVEAMLLPQKNGRAHTDIEPEDVHKLMFEMRNVEGQIRFWWHSHVNMDVFWSGTDMTTIRELGAHGWFLSTVFNKRNELRSAYYEGQAPDTIWGPKELFLDKLETDCGSFRHAKADEWDAEYKAKVTNVVPASPAVTSGGWGHTPSRFPRYGSLGDYYDEYYGTELDRDADDGAPPRELGKRPKGMPKKQWNKLKKQHEKERQPALISPTLTQTDDYGFTREERSWLASEGIDQHDIDELVDYDFTPMDILSIARSGVLASEVIDMVDQGWMPTDVIRHLRNVSDDVPVADRGKAN